MTQLEPLPSVGKPAIQSTTLWGALVALIGALAPPLLAHLNLVPADAREATGDLQVILTAAGSLVAIWGRARTNAPLPPITTLIKKEN